MFEFVEEALDEVSVAIQERAERGDIDAARHRLDCQPVSNWDPSSFDRNALL